MTRRTPGTVTIEIARTSNDRLKTIRDAKAARLDRQVTIREALDDVLDWWDATADMRNMGIDGDALNDLASKPVPHDKRWFELYAEAQQEARREPR